MRDFRKPLVVMSPKSLLRHPRVVSGWKEFEKGSFQELIKDPVAPTDKSVERLILCSGKLYYDLEKAREDDFKNRMKDTAIVRLEQLYPLPETQLNQLIQSYPKLKRLIWAQEEPKNMGAWSYIFPQLLDLKEKLGLKGIEIEYVGRSLRASPATGSHKTHAKEQQDILNKSLS